VAEVNLEIIEGPNSGARLKAPLPGEIGRDPAAEFALDDELVSRRHARVAWDPRGHATLEDLGSRNGTFLNGQPLQGLASLMSNDTILVGVTVLRVCDPADSGDRPTQVVKIPAALRTPQAADSASSKLDELLDVRIKAKARTAPLAIFILVVFVLLVYLALQHHT
jgi:predicted component of type VI protein secretion system